MELVVPGVIEGQTWGWFAPSYKILGDAWRDAKRLLAPVALRISEQDKRIETLSGGVVEYWSLDNPDAGRSRRYHGVIVDEAGAAAKLEEAWNAAIRPTLLDYRGEAWFPSTPKGMNFFWRAFTWGEDAHQPDWASWSMPTATNPFIDPEELEQIKTQVPERFYRQEILAEFIEEAGGIFRGVRDAVDAGRSQDLAPETGRLYTLGVDLARSQDFTVLSVVDDLGRQAAFERFNQISWERQIASIAQMAARYRARVIVDSTGVGDPIFERLRSLGLGVEGYHLSHQSKESLIDNLAMLIEQRRVSLMDAPEQTSELLAYEYDISEKGTVRMSAPAGMHDDTVIALALSCWGLRSRRKPISSIATQRRAYV